MNKLIWPCLALVLLVTGACSNKGFFNFDALAKRDNLTIQEITYNHLSAKGKLRYTDARNSQKAVANIRMKQDSIIWFSLAAGVGIEGTRALITRDSIFIVDRINKEYVKYDFEGLSQRLNFNVNFDMLQDMMLGNMLMQYKVKEDEMERLEAFFLIKQKNGPLNIASYVGRKSLKLERVEVNETATTNNMVLTYNNFSAIDRFYFPYNSTYTINFIDKENTQQETKIDLEINKVEFTDKNLKFPFNIPQKYTRRQY